ncbi:MAG: hypothetical protein ACREMV_02975 [Gemmatimonadales bacterium]
MITRCCPPATSSAFIITLARRAFPSTKGCTSATRDGQTVVLGGLRGLQREATQRGVPILAAIPVVGGLFGSADRRTTETELFLFLTPRVIRTDTDADSLAAPRLPKGTER